MLDGTILGWFPPVFDWCGESISYGTAGFPLDIFAYGIRIQSDDVLIKIQWISLRFLGHQHEDGKQSQQKEPTTYPSA